VHGGGEVFAVEPTRVGTPEIKGAVTGLQVEPAGDRAVGFQVAGPAGQQEENGLGDILGPVLVAQDATGGGDHHGSVAANQFLEGSLAALPLKLIEQLLIGCVHSQSYTAARWEKTTGKSVDRPCRVVAGVTVRAVTR